MNASYLLWCKAYALYIIEQCLQFYHYYKAQNMIKTATDKYGYL